MQRKLIALAAAVLLTLAIVGPATAVTNGVPDGGNHPYVGLLVFDAAPGQPSWRCTGSLISPTVVLTAGHCTDGAVAARVWFDQTVTPGADSGYPYGGPKAFEGTPYTFPGYVSLGAPGLTGFSFGDVGVVVLSEPVPTSIVGRDAELPSAGVVDTLANKTPLDYVGYGVQYQDKSLSHDPRARWTGPRTRMYAFGELISGEFKISDDVMKVTMNPGGGSGGTCFGDSGGPDLLGGTDTVLAVNSFVTNVNCSGVGYDTRVDLPERLAWINSFMPTSSCTFSAPDTSYYDGATAEFPLYATGPISFTWTIATGTVTGGTWDELHPPVGGIVYHNVVDSGTYADGAVNLTLSRIDPDAYGPFVIQGNFVGGSFTGTAAGPYLLTALGKLVCK